MQWAVHHYNVSHQPQPFNPPANKTAVCDSSIALDSKYFIDWADAHIPPDQAFTFTEDDIARITRLSSTIESAFLKFLGINHTFETAGEDAPWFHCFDPLCQQLINAGDDCEDWDVLLNIPDSTDRKVAYLAAVYTSWFLIFITALIVFFAFNAFPNYDSSESWERTVRSLSQLCCCSNVLDVAETEMGDSASKEIGNMLHMLFGGIDLDPTDQVLGMYLVAERQRWRQRKHVIAKLKAAGIKPQPKPPTLFRKLFGRCLPARKGSYSRKLSQTASQVVLSSEMTSVTAPGGQAGMEALVRKPEPSPAAAKAVSGGSIAPSPFANSGSFESSGSRRLRPTRSIEYRPPSIAQSFVRLVSVKISRDSTGAPSASVVANNGDAVLEDGLSSPLSETMSVAAVEKALVVDDRHQPLLTPVNLRKVGIRVPLTSFEAAEIYIGQKSRAVPQVLLEEALQMSRFAKAAYGLQTVRWKAATTGSIVTDTLDRFLACCSPLSKPLGLENRFRKRNYNAILDITGACPEDLLYVSYTTAAFGVLPYMLLLHRPTRSVVLSVRGTVGFENLITDLLSNPVDASDAMPDWVLEATGHSRKSTGGEEVNDPESGQLFAHSGILSSTNSVLRDLEAKGLLDSMKDIHSGAQELAGSPCAETGANRADPHPHLHSNADMLENINKLEADDEVNLSLERARSAVNEAVVGQGWRIVVTGHSLGAAVACMLSFHLKEHFPSLQCFALCPPGGLMSAPLCRLSRQFCTSVVVGADAISRLAIPTTQRTVDDMVLALARCKRPKLAVFMDALLGRRKDPATAPPTFCAFEDVGPEALAALRKYVATSKLHSAGLDDRQLFPPGRIIHLRAFAASGKKKGPEAEVWDAVWVGAQGECLHFG